MTMQFFAQLPEDVQANLRRVSPLRWEGIDVQVQRLDRLSASVPQSKVWSGLRYVVGRMRGSRQVKGALKVVGATIGGTIFIDPDFADWNTASGLALLAHERVHVEQDRTIPDFDRLYAEAQVGVSPGRPWDNPYEMEAYCLEARTWYALTQQGMPSGNWLPLGVSLGFCAA